MVEMKSDSEIAQMREAGKIVAEVLARVEEKIKPGITTGELDRLADETIAARGAQPAFKGYRGFPATLCTSVNEQVVHGIPGTRVLTEGDIISIDCGVLLNGFYGDAAKTFAVGQISEDKQNLLTVTEQSLMMGISKVAIGNRLSDISAAIQIYVEEKGMSVVRDYTGHGIGRQLHESPEVRNFGRPGRGPRLEKGMVLAIEPMVNLGVYQVNIERDKWTVITKDRMPSAHFEHTVAVTENGYDILTLLE
ncbi:MAG: type I methionyl aminopeptidase [Peptococcaceae bacterium]|jgi:methionyl aminopeptidase|nr:type I methionyl aminopeptidase [Peptococcaceae bacterium]